MRDPATLHTLQTDERGEAMLSYALLAAAFGLLALLCATLVGDSVRTFGASLAQQLAAARSGNAP